MTKYQTLMLRTLMLHTQVTAQVGAMAAMPRAETAEDLEAVTEFLSSTADELRGLAKEMDDAQ